MRPLQEIDPAYLAISSQAMCKRIIGLDETAGSAPLSNLSIPYIENRGLFQGQHQGQCCGRFCGVVKRQARYREEGYRNPIMCTEGPERSVSQLFSLRLENGLLVVKHHPSESSIATFKRRICKSGLKCLLCSRFREPMPGSYRKALKRDEINR